MAAAAAIPAAAIPAAATPTIDLSTEESKHNASTLWSGACHATAAGLIPDSTTTHTNVNVVASFSQKDIPCLWAYFTKCSPAVPSGPNQGKNMKCYVAGAARVVLSTSTTAKKALIRHLHKCHEAEGKLVFAASSRPAHAKNQRAEALVEASGSTSCIMGRSQGRPMNTRRPPHGQGEAAHPEPTSHYPRPGPAHPFFKYRRWSGRAHWISWMPGRDPARLGNPKSPQQYLVR